MSDTPWTSDVDLRGRTLQVKKTGAVIPLDRVVANINVDVINYLGPTRDMVLLGADRSTLGPMAQALAQQRGRVIGEDQHPERGYFFRSDHFPLAKAGVPGGVALTALEISLCKDAKSSRLWRVGSSVSSAASWVRVAARRSSVLRYVSSIWGLPSTW